MNFVTCSPHYKAVKEINRVRVRKSIEKPIEGNGEKPQFLLWLVEARFMLHLIIPFRNLQDISQDTFLLS